MKLSILFVLILSVGLAHAQEYKAPQIQKRINVFGSDTSEDKEQVLRLLKRDDRMRISSNAFDKFMEGFRFVSSPEVKESEVSTYLKNEIAILENEKIKLSQVQALRYELKLIRSPYGQHEIIAEINLTVIYEGEIGQTEKTINIGARNLDTHRNSLGERALDRSDIDAMFEQKLDSINKAVPNLQEYGYEGRPAQVNRI